MNFWFDILRLLHNRKMLICVFTGFSSGLPLYVIYTLIPAWLRADQVNLKEIGLFALIGIPYTWKFLWSPVMDRYIPPFLGRRRGWMIMSQLLLLVSIASLGFFQPQQSLWTIAYLATAVAFFSASQDIVLDAYRREILDQDELGPGNGMHVAAYRIAGLIPGSLALILADHMQWWSVYIIVALFMVPGICMTLMVSEPVENRPPPRTFREAVVEPFHEFFQRLGTLPALEILAFMFLYKLGDSLATALSTPFYQDMGFTLTEIGVVAKHAGLWPMIIGGLLGALLMVRIGINRALWLFGLVQIITILGFVWLANVGHSLVVLAVVVSLEYLGVGLGTAAFVAFIARSTNRVFAATQFALLTALTALPRTFANATTGYLVEGANVTDNPVAFGLMSSLGLPTEGMGWSSFFLFCTVAALPGMLLLLRVAPWNGDRQAPNASSEPQSETR